MRKILTHSLATLIGIYLGLLLNSKLHFDTLSHSLEPSQFHYPAQIQKNETVRERKVESKPIQAHQQHREIVDTDGAITVIDSNTARHPICQRLNPLAPPLTYWTRYSSRIHAATQLTPYDTKYHFHDVTAQLLQLVSPRLPYSVLSIPHDWTSVESILTKAFARYEYLLDPSNKPFQPPVKMVILGGSVLVGRNCRKLMKDLDIRGMLLPNRACTWAYRLQVFFDQLFGIPDIVQITKISMGGTNTNIGAQIFKYDLLPQAARNPDIVLNAYSTNDMHILTILEAQSNQNQTLRDRVFEMTQDFVRVVLQDQPCSNATTRPLLLHLDDYLGNEQREIWATTELAQGVGVLAHYYGFATMSYANVVRQWVYGDTRESWFSPEGWYPPNSNKMEREIHPGMGMHITTTWVVAYNLLNLVTTYCSLEPWLSSTEDAFEYSKSFLAESLPLNGHKSVVPGKPRVPPTNLPPLLTPQLSLETISDDWRASHERKRAELAATDCSKRGSSRCIFSWVSGMSQQHDNTTWIEEYFGSRQVKSKGWKLVNDGGKLGYSPSAIGDEVVLEFSLPQPIRTVTFFTLKSYGSKWEGSKLRVVLQGRQDEDGDWEELVSEVIPGFHNKETSEMYTSAFNLPVEAKEGTLLRVCYLLESGETFKIMGLAVCS